MKVSRVTTAAFLAGATTLAVSLPVLAEQKNFDLSGFDEILVSSGLSAEVEVGPDFSVTAESSSNRTLKYLDIRVSGNKLIVERDKSWTDFSLFSAPRDATVKVTLPVLTEIVASAGSDVVVQGDYGEVLSAKSSSGADLELDGVDGGSIRLAASSGSDRKADGICDTLDVQASSGADIDADDLECASVDANVSSGASIRAHADSELDAHASSGGDVRVAGNPETVEKHESSGGDVRLN